MHRVRVMYVYGLFWFLAACLVYTGECRTCTDDHELCGGWAGVGMCNPQVDNGYMRDNCRLSCGTCNGGVDYDLCVYRAVRGGAVQPTNDIHPREMFFLVCNEGYKLKGNRYATCGYDGQLLTPLGKCVRSRRWEY